MSGLNGGSARPQGRPRQFVCGSSTWGHRTIWTGPTNDEHDRKFEGLASASDDTLLEVGKAVCEGFREQNLDFGRVTQSFVESDAHLTTEQATTLIRTAVRNLCP